MCHDLAVPQLGQDTSGRYRPERAVARLPWLIAGVAVLVWVAVAGRYGFHRDELYFIEGGRNPALGQPDNPMLVPWLAAGWHDLVRGNLAAFRVLPALAGAGTILAAARTASALGGAPRQQTLTALFVAVSAFPLSVGHLFSTATFDLLLTTCFVLAVIRAVGEPGRISRWIAVGVLIGLALEVKLLAGLVVVCLIIALIVLGPAAVRGTRLLRLRGFWVATAIALVLAAPYLVWQTVHGWPMLEVAGSIAGGGSASSADRATVLPLMLLLVSPVLGPLMIIGFVAAFRIAALRPFRWLSLAFGLLAVLVVVTGGKPYYVAGLFAAGLALSTWPLLRVLDRARRRRFVAAGVLAVVSSVVVVLSLPLAPVGSLPFRMAKAVNPDTAETVGWDILIDSTVAAVATVPADQRADTVIITRNYGEAGALARARRLGVELPPVFSGHNAFYAWGPPPASTRRAVVVGDVDPAVLATAFGTCTVVDEVHSPPGADNEEDGAPIRICRDPREPWAQLWPTFRRYR